MPYGFAGLSSMVSDVDEVIHAANRAVAKASGQPQSGTQPAARSEGIYDPKPRASSSKKGWWIAAAIGLVIWIWIASLTDTSPSGSAGYGNATAPTPTTYEPAPFSVDASAESAPPVESGHILTRAELHYCLAQAVRLDAADKAVNTYVETQVNAFNAMVDDFNVRCRDARYSKDDIDAVKADVDSKRTTLEQEGRDRITAQ